MSALTSSGKKNDTFIDKQKVGRYLNDPRYMLDGHLNDHRYMRMLVQLKPRIAHEHDKTLVSCFPVREKRGELFLTYSDPLKCFQSNFTVSTSVLLGTMVSIVRPHYIRKGHIHTVSKAEGSN